MNKYAFVLFCCASLFGCPATGAPGSPQAHLRPSGQNYKDMMLAKCVSSAYEKEPGAANDAGASAAVMLEWIDLDLDASIDPSNQLLKSWLQRDYQHPLAHQYKNIRFDLLKCIDMYHSKELADQVKRYVSKPARHFRQKK